MRNKLIIFSKNRPCQLHLLLESIKLNSNNFFDLIEVIFTYDIDYKYGYSLLINRFNDVLFTLEKDFKQDTLLAIDSDFEFTTFLVDDTIYYNKNKVNKPDILKTISNDVICFSLRLGINCCYSHPANLHYKIIDYICKKQFYLIDFRKQEPGDFAYPLSLDGHVFNTVLIKNIIKQIYFINPNTLEANLQVANSIIPSNIVFFEQSNIVGVPVNLVNNVFKNRNGLIYPISEKELNNKYVDNYVIDISTLDFTNINGPHKEIKYEFKKYG